MVSELAEEVVDYEGEDPDMPAAPAPREAQRRAHTPAQQQAVRQPAAAQLTSLQMCEFRLAQEMLSGEHAVHP